MSRSRYEPNGSGGWQPLVSIVTPVLNRGSTLASCLASVAAQTYPYVEHIVVDGGSTDGTLDILRSFSASHPLRWVTGKDEGMYDAINKGQSLATGDVLAYLNSDDLYVPWSVEAAVEKLAEGPDLIFGDLAFLQLRTRESHFYIQFYPPFDLRLYTHVASIGQPTVFWRRSLSDQIGGFDTDYRLIGDCEYWLRAAVSGAKISHLNEVLAIQVDHGETLRATQSKLLWEELKRMRAYYSEFAGPPPRIPKLASYRRSLTWRGGQCKFFLNDLRKRPKKWPKFISFMRRHGLRINRLGAVAIFMLPGRFRPYSATWVEVDMFERAILDEIRAPDHEPLTRIHWDGA